MFSDFSRVFLGFFLGFSGDFLRLQPYYSRPFGDYFSHFFWASGRHKLGRAGEWNLGIFEDVQQVLLPGVSKGCFLEAFKHSFVTPASWVWISLKCGAFWGSLELAMAQKRLPRKKHLR